LNDFFFCLSFWPIRILSACTCVYNYRVNSSIEESVSSFQQYSVISVKIHVLWNNIIVVVMHALFHSEIGISLTKECSLSSHQSLGSALRESQNCWAW